MATWTSSPPYFTAAQQAQPRLYCSIEDAWRSDVPGMADLTEVDFARPPHRDSTLCPFASRRARPSGPDLPPDLCKSYEIDGLLFFNEHNGPLLEATRRRSQSKNRLVARGDGNASSTNKRRANAA